MSTEKPVVAAPPTGEPAAPTTTRRRRRRIVGLLLAPVVLVAAALGLAYWNNNCNRMSDAEFAAAIDQALQRGRTWVQTHAQIKQAENQNISEYFLLLEMDRLHPTPVFAELVRWYLDQPTRPAFWKRQLDPRWPVSAREMNDALSWTALDYRWSIYATGPEHVTLAPADQEALLDTERWDGLYLAHQLWAFCQFRRFAADPHAHDARIDRLAERIASEHTRDFLYHEIHAERVGLLMWSGHPERIRRRWLERIIETQLADGGWNERWFVLTMPAPWYRGLATDVHSTYMALWALHWARYQHPELFGLPPAAAPTRN